MSALKPFRYFMPAEWNHHSATWMLFPYRKDTWKNNGLNAQIAFLNVAKSISKFEHVKMGCLPHLINHAKNLLSKDDLNNYNITFYEMEYNDGWMRDTGPTFIIKKEDINNNSIAGIDWIFNAWGGLLPSWEKDEQVASRVLEIESIPTSLRYKADFVLEGGSIHVDGEGTLLTTEECLLHNNRNPALTKLEIENKLIEYLDIQKIIWLPKGLNCDEDTNGHIDNFCCFVKPGHVLLAWCDDENDEQYSISREAYEILSNVMDAKGRKLMIHKIPIPPPMYYTEDDINTLDPCDFGDNNPKVERTIGERLAGSYVNFYIANKGIILPSFSSLTDKVASDILQELFPDYEIIQVPGRDILLGGGNIHCITQQVPSIE